MNTVNRFFRKYIFSSFLIVLAFLLVNIFLLIGLLLASWNNSSSPDIPISSIADLITQTEQGMVTSDVEAETILSNHNAWAMVLNDSGMVIWECEKPDELPSMYTVTQVAKFTRWYLQEYPILVQELPFGLLVVGGEPNSMVKYNLIMDIGNITTLMGGAVCIFLINLLLMLILFWRNTHKVEKAVSPILSGIETMAHGGKVSLPENGELADINAGLNQAGNLLVKKDHARAEWINGITHDVRTPLSIMLGYSGEIEDNPQLPEDTRAQAGIIRQQGEKLRSLIADLNLTSKLEYSMQPLRNETAYPVELTRQVVSNFLNNNLDGKHHLEFEASTDAEALTVQGDSALLTRMLENLIQNSITHNPDGCCIAVAVQKKEHGCLIKIADDGIGLSENQMTKFKHGDFRTEPSTDEVAHGFGLRIVWQIAHAHRGSIVFEDAHPHGLIVCVSLPLKA